MLVKGYWVTLASFEPPLPSGECASCGAASETFVRVARDLTAPYCRACAARTRFLLRFVVRFIVLVLVGLAIVVPPVYIAAFPLLLAFALPPFVLGAGALAYGISREIRRPAGNATTQQDAVRLVQKTPPSFFCSNRRFMERLVDAHGGVAAPGTQRQWDVAWSAVVAGGSLLGIVWLALLLGNDGTLMIDNGGADDVTVWIDGRPEAHVSAGAHERIHIRPGAHTFAWSTRVAKSTPDRSVRIDAQRSYLYNPGPTTCYWHSVAIYEKRGPAHDPRAERDDDGPLAVDELHELVHPIDRWFEPNPGSKEISDGEYATDYAIVRDPGCSKLLASGCPRTVLDELVRCESAAKHAEGVNACMKQAQAACGGGEQGTLL